MSWKCGSCTCLVFLKWGHVLDTCYETTIKHGAWGWGYFSHFLITPQSLSFLVLYAYVVYLFHFGYIRIGESFVSNVQRLRGIELDVHCFFANHVLVPHK